MIDAEISKYEEKDFRPLAELFKNIYSVTYPTLSEQFLRPERFEAILRKHTLPNFDVWLAKINGELIGFAAIGQNFIDQLYISPAHQGSGLGSFWVEQAKMIYPDFLELYTLASNKRAIGFYEKHGFTIIEILLVIRKHWVRQDSNVLFSTFFVYKFDIDFVTLPASIKFLRGRWRCAIRCFGSLRSPADRPNRFPLRARATFSMR